MKLAILILLPLALFASDKEDAKTRKELRSIIEAQRKIDARFAKVVDKWEKRCKGEGLVRGKDRYDEAGTCIPAPAAPKPEPPKPEPPKETK